MRDVRFKAIHRGGLLTPQRHRLLAIWAADCADHVLPLFGEPCPRDDRPRRAIETARAWTRGEIAIGEVRAAAAEAHAAARSAPDEAARAAARAAGHSAATAHMADHALRAAACAVQAVQASGNGRDDAMSGDRERTWQQERLPEEIRALVLSSGEGEATSD